MKIVHFLLGKANPHSMNGVNKVVHHLATELHKFGCDVEVWGVTATPHIVRHQHDYQLRLFQKALFRFFLREELGKAIRNLPSHTVVHLHSVFIPELYTMSRHLKNRKIPWILTPHGGYAPESLKKNHIAKRVYMRLFESSIVRDAEVLHAIGKSEVNDTTKYFIPKRIALIPNGQDLNALAFSRKKLNRLNRPVFGFCGRLSAYLKGLDLLIKGFSIYKNAGGSGELWLIGDGKDRESLRAQAARSGISDDVVFLGSMFGEEKLNRLGNLDVYVHTSRWDGLPMAVLEASGLSKPLLVSQESNLGEYVDSYGAGLVLTDNTPTQIAKAMGRMAAMFSDGTLDAMGEGALQMIRRDLNWESAVEKMLALYETIVSEGVG